MDDYEGDGRRRRTKSTLSSSMMVSLQRATGQLIGKRAAGKSKKDTDTFEFSYRDRTDSSGKRAFRVQMPRRILYYTLAVFLVLPIFCFVWKETHLHSHHDTLVHKSTLQTQSHHSSRDRFPTWMETEGDEKAEAADINAADAVVVEAENAEQEGEPQAPPLVPPKEDTVVLLPKSNTIGDEVHKASVQETPVVETKLEDPSINENVAQQPHEENEPDAHIEPVEEMINPEVRSSVAKEPDDESKLSDSEVKQEKEEFVMEEKAIEEDPEGAAVDDGIAVQGDEMVAPVHNIEVVHDEVVVREAAEADHPGLRVGALTR